MAIMRDDCPVPFSRIQQLLGIRRAESSLPSRSRYHLTDKLQLSRHKARNILIQIERPHQPMLLTRFQASMNRLLRR